MEGKLTKADIAMLAFIAEYRILTVKQLSALTTRSLQVLRRRLRFLKKEHLISLKERGFGRGPGRREDIIILTENGLKLLRSSKSLSANTAYVTDKTSDLIFIDHDLLRNWFFVHLIQIERKNPQFNIQLVTNGFNLLGDEHFQGPTIMERFPSANDPKNDFILIPDGVFIITDKHSEKSLLFFLEVDMGSEPLVKTMRTPGDIRHKIICYQTLFHNKRYKRYEKVFHSRFNGFRLLFLTSEPGRMKSICNLVQEIPLSDFIWITTQEKMFSHGITAEIWAKNGRYDTCPQSILGQSLAFEAPVTGLFR